MEDRISSRDAFEPNFDMFSVFLLSHRHKSPNNWTMMTIATMRQWLFYSLDTAYHRADRARTDDLLKLFVRIFGFDGAPNTDRRSHLQCNFRYWQAHSHLKNRVKTWVLRSDLPWRINWLRRSSTKSVWLESIHSAWLYQLFSALFDFQMGRFYQVLVSHPVKT